METDPGDDSPMAAFACLFDKIVLGRHNPSKEAITQYFSNFIADRNEAFGNGKVPPFYDDCKKIWDNLIDQFKINGTDFYEGRVRLLPSYEGAEPTFKEVRSAAEALRASKLKYRKKLLKRTKLSPMK